MLSCGGHGAILALHIVNAGRNPDFFGGMWMVADD
jgi:hypothetical protein